MTLVEQAEQRIALAREIGATPWRWVVTPQAEAILIAEAPADAWSEDWDSLFDIPLERGRVKSEWGLDLLVAPRAS